MVEDKKDKGSAKQIHLVTACLLIWSEIPNDDDVKDWEEVDYQQLGIGSVNAEDEYVSKHNFLKCFVDRPFQTVFHVAYAQVFVNCSCMKVFEDYSKSILKGGTLDCFHLHEQEDTYR